jgi:amino acid adenylation domain-containing protein
VAIYLASHGHFAGVSTAVRMPSHIYNVQIHSVLDDTDRVVEQLNAFRPHRIGGYSSSVATLAELALQGSLQIHPKTILVSGDKLTAHMEQSIWDAWNLPIHVLYSASESLCIAIKTPGTDEMTVLDELNSLEVLDHQDEPVLPGTAGRAVLTNLYNYTFPIIRYELGDYLTVGSTNGTAGVTSLRDIEGRLRDALPVVLQNGNYDTIHPIALAEFFVPGLTRIQFVSVIPEYVLINYVASSDLSGLIQREFQRILRIKGATRTRFEVHRKEHIPNDPNTGKFALVKIEPPKADVNSLGNHSETAFVTSMALNSSMNIVRSNQNEIGPSIIDRFEMQVAKYPERIAVKTKRIRLTYTELNEAANRMARAIVGKRGQEQEPIALLLENGAPIMTAIFGVLKAGKLYMPLDPSYPQARIRATLEDSQARLIITSSRHHTQARESAGNGVQVINIDDLEESVSSENLQLPLSADTLACILYTSGSTGEPKGVVHSHRNIMHKTMEYTSALHFSMEDKIALLSPCTFSLSVGFIFGALLNGACLYPVDVRGEGLVHLADWFRQEEITVYNSVPTVFRNFADTLPQQENLPKLRLIHLGGEPVTAKDVELYKKHFSPHCVLLHHVGSNETGTIAQCFIDKKTPVHGNTAPAGQPAQDSKVLVLDDDGNPLGFNRVGEIAVQSRYLAVGYWRKPELTRAAFLPDPAGSDERIYRTGDLGLLRPDGSLEHYGRKDFQVKIRGQRVEVIEIDMALANHGAVKEAVTVAREDAQGDKYLVAYVVPASEPAATSKELRLFLQQRLPDYMVPSSIVFLDALPLTPNGKLDRQALPAPTPESVEDAPGHVLPKDTVERRLADIWEKLLGVHQVAIHHNFFDIGGHSLLLIKLHGELEAAFGVDIPMIQLFRSPTISAQAEYLSQATNPRALQKSGDSSEQERAAQQRQRGLQALAQRRASTRHGA